MKKVFLLFLLSFLIFSTKGQRLREESEFFLEIREPGKFIVYVNDEMIGSGTGAFRFFDLRPGKCRVVVEWNGRQIEQEDIILNEGVRTIASFSRNNGLEILTEREIYRNGRYSLDNWDGGSLTYDNARGQEKFYDRLRLEEFVRLRETLKKESFDENKQKLFKIALKNTLITVSQLSNLLNLFSFEDKKLECAIYAYNHTWDIGNFYLVREFFSFQSNKEKIDNFLSNN